MARSGTKSLVIRAAADRLQLFGDVEQELRLLAETPLHGLLSRPTARSLDLLNLAAGVYAVDRAVKRRAEKGNDTGIRSLHLHVEVQDYGFWRRTEISESVAAILTFLTDENWSLSFTRGATMWSPQAPQPKLDLPWTQKPGRIALYSGGLDSASGLASRVLSGVNDHMLVTVGHQSGLRHRCAAQVKTLAKLTKTQQQLHTTLIVALRGGASRRISQQERSQRTRAFLFCSAAAVVAQACEVADIDVFENGVGAINLPPMTGMLVGGLATRGAHPTFLRLMGELTSAVMERSMYYSLPFMERTKAEVLADLKAAGLEEWLQLSRSCVHTSWRERKVSHCGQCPGCIERRQAFRIAGIPELIAGQYSLDILSRQPLVRENLDYLRCYLADAAAWLKDDALAHRRLEWHLAATQVPADFYEEIAERQRRHAQEVMATFGHLTAQRVVRRTSRRRSSRPLIYPDTLL